MDLFFVVLVLLLLAFPVIAIVALVKSVGLGQQLRRIEARLAAIERGGAVERPAPTAPPEPPIAPTAEAIAPTAHPTATPLTAPASSPIAPQAGRAERTRTGNRRIRARCAAEPHRRRSRHPA